MDQLSATIREFYQGREIAVMDRDYCCNAVVTADEHTGHQVVVDEDGELCVNVEIIEGTRRGEVRAFDVLLLETLTEEDERYYEGVEGAQLPSEKTAMTKQVAALVAREHRTQHESAEAHAACALCGFDEQEATRRYAERDFSSEEKAYIAETGRAFLAETIGESEAERYFEALRVLSGGEVAKGEERAATAA